MKKLLIFLLISSIAVSCTTTKGYDYQAHKQRSKKAADYYKNGGGCRKHKNNPFTN